MVEGTTPSPPHPPARRLSREETTVWAIVTISVPLVIGGVADGLIMALKRTVRRCPNGHYFSPGTTNFTCYVHPHAGAGVAIAVFSVLLGFVITLSCITAMATIRAGCARAAVDADEGGATDAPPSGGR